MEDPAPFRSDLAEAPDGVECVWRQAQDGVRLRGATWRPANAKGSVLLYTGRTEYIEKYGRVIQDLTLAGLAVATMDWRGQGLSDRVHADPMIGHVRTFLDYQWDVTELVAMAEDAKLPKPWFLLAHSMGGCIGLRSLVEGLPVERAVFSSPMWGIHISIFVKPLSVILPPVARLFGLQNSYAPGTRGVSYVKESDVASNMLTSDPEHFQWMLRHVEAEDRFGLGGPSIHWMQMALHETRDLLVAARPSLPVLTLYGSDEKIVSTRSLEQMHDGWGSAELHCVPGGRHELMMEAPEIRRQFMEATLNFLI